MSVLLLRPVGPMQSWGVQSRFTVRDTGLEPSKSGTVGLLCAALGRCRHEPIADLAAWTRGVRADQEGSAGDDREILVDRCRLCPTGKAGEKRICRILFQQTALRAWGAAKAAF